MQMGGGGETKQLHTWPEKILGFILETTDVLEGFSIL